MEQSQSILVQPLIPTVMMPITRSPLWEITRTWSRLRIPKGKGDIVRYNLQPKPSPADSAAEVSMVAIVPPSDPVVMISGKVIDSEDGRNR